MNNCWNIIQKENINEEDKKRELSFIFFFVSFEFDEIKRMCYSSSSSSSNDRCCYYFSPHYNNPYNICIYIHTREKEREMRCSNDASLTTGAIDILSTQLKTP